MPNDNHPVRSLVGERVYLRPNDRTDFDRIRRWLNDPEVSRFLFHHRLLDELGQERQYESRDRSATPRDLWLAVVLTAGNRHIGQVGLHAIDYVHGHATSGIVIGEQDCWRKGYAQIAKHLLLAHAFDTLRLHRVTADVFSDNEASIRQLEATGYALEGRRREHMFRDGRWHDELTYGILETEWRAKRLPTGR